MTDNVSRQVFAEYLREFSELSALQDRLLHVLCALPSEVQQDFLQDPRFTVSIDNYERGKGSSVFMAVPGPNSSPSRSIVLKPLLNQSSAEFAYYVIAHEFAHAFLRNGPWGEILDIELAADALAAHWGFHRPAVTPWSRRGLDG